MGNSESKIRKYRRRTQLLQFNIGAKFILTINIDIPDCLISDQVEEVAHIDLVQNSKLTSVCQLATLLVRNWQKGN